MWRRPYIGLSFEYRRQSISGRLRKMVDIFTIDASTYAIMSNHYHVVLHVETDKIEGWTAHQIIAQ
ncbi:hypothetical protein [Candidatus Thiodiazotropha sp. CDECU1]|uniref:hypothetical protein n=1 Tax=Candidatus Thiodiazotropha sp. CDECU1 TaxID=3065865 RepID=UPI00293092C8|nr:hypothetical protein [Candidatus Thiodiazotropha sp. CDECU1]